MSIKTGPLGYPFGIEYLDIQICANMNDAVFADVERLWYKNGIALFQGQNF